MSAMIPGIVTIAREVPQLVNAGAFYAALSSALIIPDICAALEAEDGTANGTRYAAWFDQYVGHRYDQNFVGQDCYKYRCGVVHQLRGAGRGARYARVLFMIPDGNMFHRNRLNDVYNIDIRVFCSDIVAGFDDWWAEKKDDAIVQRHVNEMMNFYPRGLAPYIVGVPLIG